MDTQSGPRSRRPTESADNDAQEALSTNTAHVSQGDSTAKVVQDSPRHAETGKWAQSVPLDMSEHGDEDEEVEYEAVQTQTQTHKTIQPNPKPSLVSRCMRAFRYVILSGLFQSHAQVIGIGWVVLSQPAQSCCSGKQRHARVCVDARMFASKCEHVLASNLHSHFLMRRSTIVSGFDEHVRVCAFFSSFISSHQSNRLLAFHRSLRPKHGSLIQPAERMSNQPIICDQSVFFYQVVNLGVPCCTELSQNTCMFLCIYFRFRTDVHAFIHAQIHDVDGGGCLCCGVQPVVRHSARNL
jgi:hypothetical protein